MSEDCALQHPFSFSKSRWKCAKQSLGQEFDSQSHVDHCPAHIHTRSHWTATEIMLRTETYGMYRESVMTEEQTCSEQRALLNISPKRTDSN